MMGQLDENNQINHTNKTKQLARQAPQSQNFKNGINNANFQAKPSTNYDDYHHDNMYELNMEEGHGELNASHYLAHTPHSIVHPGKVGQGYQPPGNLLPVSYLQPLSRASHAQSGAITVKEH